MFYCTTDNFFEATGLLIEKQCFAIECCWIFEILRLSYDLTVANRWENPIVDLN